MTQRITRHALQDSLLGGPKNNPTKFSYTSYASKNTGILYAELLTNDSALYQVVFNVPLDTLQVISHVTS